jgi:hypothetical protein
MAAGFETPIVLDLNGDGVSTQNIAAGVKFDLLAQGQAVNTGWVSPTDGLLAIDLNHDGVINSGAELFCSASVLANGEKAPDGYVALSELDTNHDGVINNQDANFADLRVWVDANSDGVTEAGELKTLSDLKISQLSLTTDTVATDSNGNLVGLNSSYQTSDGATHAAADVWFKVDLRSNVTNLTQVMSEYNSNDTAAVPVSLTDGVNTPDVNQPVLAVANLVDAMKQFDQGSPVSAEPGSFIQDTADLAKAQIAQSAATDLLSKSRPDVHIPSGFLGMPK